MTEGTTAANPTPGTLRIVDDATAGQLLDLGAAFAAILDAYRQSAETEVLSTPPALIMHHDATGMKAKGALLPATNRAGFRLVADHDSPGGEVSHDWQWVADLATGRPVGLVEMLTLHAVRTALTGVAALDTLHGAPGVVAIIGAGRIARWLVAPLRERGWTIRVAASRPERAAAFAAKYEVMATPGVDEAVADADAVIAISSAPSPVVMARHLRPGMTVIGMGGGHEFDRGILDGADRFVVDDFAFACVVGSVAGWLGAGAARADIAARLDAALGQVIAGRQPGRRNSGEAVLAIVQGMACCDLAIASFILARAEALGLGRTVMLES